MYTMSVFSQTTNERHNALLCLYAVYDFFYYAVIREVINFHSTPFPSTSTWQSSFQTASRVSVYNKNWDNLTVCTI